MTELSGTTHHEQVAQAALHLADLARRMVAGEDVVEVVQAVVDAAVREVPGADHAGVTVVDRAGVSTPAASDELVVLVDAVQYRVRQGPCLEAADRSTLIRSDDLSTETRWPRFAAAAADYGVHSMLSFPLFTEDATIGALNLYATVPAAFGDESEQIGFLLAAHAAAALVATRKHANLRTALDNRDLIGQAKGILMERYKINAEQAIALLISASQRANIKLRDIADHLAQTGELVARDR